MADDEKTVTIAIIYALFCMLATPILFVVLVGVLFFKWWGL